MTITVHNDLKVDVVRGLHNTTADFRGCPNCAAQVMAELMGKNEEFRNIMFKSLMIYSVEAAKKEG